LHNSVTHKLLEINYLKHHRCLDIKGVFDLSQVNFCRLFLTPFYSLPMGFAGTSAGTFWGVYQLKTDPFPPIK
jgi:hypothetical protein